MLERIILNISELMRDLRFSSNKKSTDNGKILRVKEENELIHLFLLHAEHVGLSLFYVLHLTSMLSVGRIMDFTILTLETPGNWPSTNSVYIKVSI